MLYLIIFALLALLAYVITRQPDAFIVSRSQWMQAAPEAIFPWINSQRKMAEWSPWVKMDPQADYAYSGPEEGVGAQVSWKGKKTGQGVSTVSAVQPYESVDFQLDFLKPMKCTNTARFDLKPQDGGTNVTWSMQGKNSFIGKAMSLFMNCEKMVGTQFAQGLVDLKSMVEGR